MKSKEAQLQSECVQWFRLQYPDKIIYAIPNGGSRNIIEASNLKKQGILSGVADLHLPIRSGNYHSLFIEMKYDKGKQTESQIAFQNKVEKFDNKYLVIRSFDEFVTEIKNYFNIK